jgi:formylmethanofuran dehydrogenase subunit D
MYDEHEQAEVNVVEMEDQDPEQLGFREGDEIFEENHTKQDAVKNEYLNSITEEGTIYSDEDARDSLVQRTTSMT